MKVSVVIVNYNVRYFLHQCLLSVYKAIEHIDAEVIVVDNVSKDDSCQMVKEVFPQTILIENTENVGFSKANNQGVAIAKGEYVLILNPDTVVGECLFKEILPFADEQSDLGALTVRLIDGTGVFLPESKRGLPTPKNSIGRMIGSNKYGYYSSYLTKDGIGKIEVLVGAFMLMKRNRYLEVGGFDEDYFMYGEDIDLSYKLTQQGYTNYYYGKSVVIHYKGECTRKDVKYLRHFYGAMNIFYKKHFKLTGLDFLVMRLGVKMWFWIKYFQLSNATILIEDTTNVLFVGDRDINIDLQLNKKIKRIPVSELIKLEEYIRELEIEEIWFEEKSMSFQNIINQIGTHRFHNVLFKILPNSTNFVIGSNSSDGRGEVIYLK
ncbi:glycosyltransferase family 2 protein [Wenyingzhuangia aestuarii]|uniref:glycosyltransferase family 2 protein n=1 Tax=Wenyingzhuangia aestuarii TaxID=1647582 RepID=UPI00143BA72F|nr:glycosyltransferase family 2 protein [Wenyingzhuangia aestuarii]NJB81699.1 GT2 family glycosyltransferase [Wenyingzhuangia aestuarii]